MRSQLTISALVLAACSSADIVVPGSEMDLAFSADPLVVSVTGGGEFPLAGVTPTKFSVSAIQRADGEAMGQFRHYLESDGFIYDFDSEVTCVSVDRVNNRAWIGGVIRRNGTTDPDLQQTIHQPGHDVWFRVQDNGERPGAADRVTFIGFEGSAGVQTSAEYCQRQLWLNNGQPVTLGEVQVH